MVLSHLSKFFGHLCLVCFYILMQRGKIKSWCTIAVETLPISSKRVKLKLQPFKQHTKQNPIKLFEKYVSIRSKTSEVFMPFINCGINPMDIF